MGVDQGRLRLKGLFAFGALVLALGYAVPTVGVASGSLTPVAASIPARPGAAPAAWKPRPLLVSQDLRVYDGRQVTFAERVRTVSAPVAFATLRVPDPTLPAGVSVVSRPGAPGAVVSVFQDELVDGDLVDSVELATASSPAAEQVVRVGTGPAAAAGAPAPDLAGAPAAFARAIAGSSTAYCDTGHTATGTVAGPGSIAVDPSVIPLGSHLYIPGYGYGWAVDTGGAIRGTIVDVWMSCPAAIQWGRRSLTIYVLAS